MNFNTDTGTVAVPLLSLGNGFGGYMYYWTLCTVFMIVLFVIFGRKGWFALAGLDGYKAIRFVTVCGVCILVQVSVELALWHSGVGDIY